MAVSALSSTAFSVPNPPAPPVSQPRAQALVDLQAATQAEARAQKSEKITLIAAPTASVGLAGGTAAIAAAAGMGLAAGIAATGGVLLGLLLVGFLIYMLVFRANEKSAEAKEVAAEAAIQSEIPAPVITPDPTPNSPAPSAPQSTTPRPALVAQPSAAQKALDAYYNAAKVNYTLWNDDKTPLTDSNGKQVQIRVAPGFRMVSGMDQPTPPEGAALVTSDLQRAGLLTAKITAEIHLMEIGRATPAHIGDITQALIRAIGVVPDAKFPAPLSYWAGVRELQWSHGIGLDCAGYVSQAAANVNTGGTSDAALDGVFLQGNEFAPDRDSRFQKISGPTDTLPAALAPGDVVPLKDPTGDVGHFLMTYEARVFSAEDQAYYGALANADLIKGGPVHFYVFDSSWGAGGDPTQPQAGVSRHVIFYNEANKQWSELITSRGQAKPWIQATNGIYDHIILGVYRYKH